MCACRNLVTRNIPSKKSKICARKTISFACRPVSANFFPLSALFRRQPAHVVRCLPPSGARVRIASKTKVPGQEKWRRPSRNTGSRSNNVGDGPEPRWRRRRWRLERASRPGQKSRGISNDVRPRAPIRGLGGKCPPAPFCTRRLSDYPFPRGACREPATSPSCWRGHWP